MKFCQRCGKEIMDEAIICIHCGCSTGANANQVTNPTDASSIGMALLGFFIPLAGLIIWLINKDSKPLMAGSAGKGALIGFIVGVVGSLIYGIFLGSFLGSMMYY